MPTQSIEDYIKVIYKLESQGQPASTSALARHLGIGDGSVTEMLKKLSEKKLIHYKPYQSVRLTEAGRKIALRTVRRHRLWEMFLVQFLGYSWDEIHEEAERLEHITSDELERRLDKALGYPKVDPHGDPIPNAKGELSPLRYRSLAEMKVGDQGTIVRVRDDSPEVLQYLTKVGLVLNKQVKVVKTIQFDGSVIIKLSTQEIPLSQALAESIFVDSK
jgi:DtxR family Mn-dependent transcriptional regulator